MEYVRWSQVDPRTAHASSTCLEAPYGVPVLNLNRQAVTALYRPISLTYTTADPEQCSNPELDGLCTQYN